MPNKGHNLILRHFKREIIQDLHIRFRWVLKCHILQLYRPKSLVLR
jgi:hypothetical protein